MLTDGKAGDEGPCVAVCEALGIGPDIRRVAPGAPWSWFMPWGPIDPREAPGQPGSPLAPPFPDLVVASGRRAVPSVRALRETSRGRSFTAILKDPGTGCGAADFIWAPSYDPVRGPNVLATLTSPHRLSPARLEAARHAPDPRVAALPPPRVAVLVGGHSRHLRFRAADGERLARGLAEVAGAGASLMITASRRTPPALRDALAGLAGRHGGFFWRGEGDNPYISMMANADAIVVTADSVNMVSEAVATGAPVLVFELPRGSARHHLFLDELRGRGLVRPFRGRLEAWAYEPLDTTPLVARALAQGLARHRAVLGLD